MRTLRAGLAVAALVAAGGCLGEGGTVALTADQQMGVSPALSGFTASNGTANTSSDGFIHFTAVSPQGLTFTMLIVGPALSAGQMVDLSAEHNFLSIDITTGPGGASIAGWSSNGGMVAVDGVSPYRLRFEGVPMLKGSGSATGSFVLDGTGTFK
jgi:hypothetical protein